MEVDHSRYIQLRKLNDVFVHVSREYWNRAVLGSKRQVGFVGNVDAKGLSSSGVEVEPGRIFVIDALSPRIVARNAQSAGIITPLSA